MNSSDAVPGDPTRSPASRAPSPVNLLVALFGTLMLALAAGAVWLLLVLSVSRLYPQSWPALVLALLVGPLVRGWMIDHRWHAAWMAALALLVASLYMRALLMAMQLAGNFGIGFIEAVRHAGASMLVHLAWLSLTPLDMAVYVAAALLAGFLAWRMGRR